MMPIRHILFSTEMLLQINCRSTTKYLSQVCTVIDCLHYCFGSDDVLVLAVANHEGRIAEFADHSGSTIRSVQDGLDCTVIKDGLAAAGALSFMAMYSRPSSFEYPSRL
jgi:hypothetical protein